MTLTIFTTNRYNRTLIEPKNIVKAETFNSAKKFEQFVDVSENGIRVEVAKYRLSNRVVRIFKKDSAKFFEKHAK